MKLKISGFKAHNHAIRLDPLMVLSASNGAGKSAVAESIRFLALGYVPGLGKRPQDTAALLRGASMKVSLELADGRTLWRRLDETSKGYRTQARCSWIESDRAKSNSEEILHLFGRDEEEVAESLDIRQLLAASPLQREARIAALLATSGAGVKETLAETLDLARAKGATADALEAAADELERRLRDGLDAALDWTNGEKRRWTAEALGKSHAEREIEERLHELPRVSADHVRDLEREAGALEARAVHARRHAQQLNAAHEELAHAEGLDRAAREARQEFEAGTWGRAELRKELSDIDRAMDALLIPPQADPAEATMLVRRARELESEARQIGDIAVPEVEPPPPSEPSPESPWSEVADISARLLQLARKDPSPVGYEILTQAQRLEQLSRTGLRLEKSVRAEAAGRLDRERRKREILAREARQRRARRDELLSQAAKAKAQADELLQAVRAAYLAAHGEAIRKRRELANRRASVRQLLGQTEAEDRETALAVERAATELDVRRRQLAEVLKESPEPEEPERLAGLRRELETLTQARAVRLELERSMSERARVDETRNAFAALEWSLQRVRERRLDEAGGPLVQGMTRILRAGGRRETPFLEADHGTCRIGWRTAGGHRVLIQTLSGGEWTLFAAALAASLIILRGPALRFLFVEAGEADPKTLQSLLAGLRSVSDSLSSVMVLTHLPVTAKGWTVIGHLPSLQAESA